MSLLSELKRRNVFKVGAAYLALGWVVVQITGTIAPAMHLPDWTIMFVVWIGAIGFPFVVVFSWVFELTPEGLKRESEIDRSQSITHVTGKRLDYIIIGMLAVAIGLFVLQYFRPPSATPTPSVASSTEVAATVPVATPTAPPVAPAVAPNDKSIAVLPFVNMSSDKEQEYFSDGISEELLNLLSKIPELKVIARTSSFSYKGKEVKVEQIAQELHVAHVLEGSVRKSGNTVRITAQLIRAGDSTHLWSETYDRPLDNIFAVQDEIAGAVVTQLKIKLLGTAPKSKAVAPEAYALFLQARENFRRASASSFERSIALNQQALTIDPDYAAAWVGLARTYVAQSFWGLQSLDEGYGLAREAIARALAIDPEYAPTHAVLGQIAMVYDGDLATAARHYQQAMMGEPTNPDIISGAARLYQNLGRVDAALELLNYAVRLDPVNAGGYAGLVHVNLARGRYEEAVENARVSLDLNPGRSSAQFVLGLALMLDGKLDEALAAMKLEAFDAWRLQGLSMVYHARGQKTESDAALAELMAKYEKAWSYDVSCVLAFRGEADRSFEWLEKAVTYKDSGLSQIAGNPLFANLRSDPRWLPFLRKIGKAPEQLAAIKFDVKLPQQ